MFESLNSIVEQCENSGGTKDFADVVIENEMRSSGTDCECVKEKMRSMWKAMLEAAHSYEDNLLSRSGLTGCDGGRFKKYASSQKTICGPFILNVITNALKMAESNKMIRGHINTSLILEGPNLVSNQFLFLKYSDLKIVLYIGITGLPVCK